MWDKVKELIGDSAPILGALLSPATGGISVAVGGLIAKHLGVVNEPQAVEMALTNNPEALLKLKELENSKEIAKLQMELENRKLDNEKSKIIIGDKQDARGREVAITEITKHLNYPIYLLAGTIVFAFFGSIVVLMNTHLDKSSGVYELLLILFGALSAKFSTVVDYFFGSSDDKK